MGSASLSCARLTTFLVRDMGSRRADVLEDMAPRRQSMIPRGGYDFEFNDAGEITSLRFEWDLGDIATVQYLESIASPASEASRSAAAGMR